MRGRKRQTKSMDFNRFTEKLQEAVRAAQGIAVRHGNQQVDVDHLLLALLQQEGGLAGSVLSRAGVDPGALARKIETDIGRLPKASGPAGGPDQIYVSQKLSKLLADAEDKAKKLKDEFISVEHVLLAAMGVKDLGAPRDRLMQALREIRGSQRVTSQNPEATYEALERYGRDLMKLAAKGKL